MKLYLDWKGADWALVVKEQRRAAPRRRSGRIFGPLSPHIGQTHDETATARDVHHSTMRRKR